MERKGANWEARNEMRNLDLSFKMASEDYTNDLAAVRRDLWNPTNDYFGSPQKTAAVMQSYHFLLIQDEQRAIRGRLIFPRDPTKVRKAGGYFSWDDNGDLVNQARLEQLLREHRDRLIPL